MASFNSISNIFSKEKTFRPKKKFEPGTLRYNLHKHAQATLNSGIDLQNAVKLPSNEGFNDWLAVHVVDFFNRINLIYGTVCDFCVNESCPIMSGGPKSQHLCPHQCISISSWIGSRNKSTTNHYFQYEWTSLSLIPSPQLARRS